ncbi:hypothetical protein mRhiFer1_008903 [Rhinolophus ferrumequinum]|uniref:Uncharacterized protein n=1 Tax=Rhinolophus ferrumequinum TaxID=59479 RepID=A0A7J7TDU4_RHIFE|nr:hypothetical protein mRhiFer1_008903 [Rhinolophus ferrumequinum]
MALLVLLFELTISFILVRGAGPETLHYIWHSEQGLVLARIIKGEQFICMKADFCEQGMVLAKALRRMVEQFVRMNTQSQEAREERCQEQEMQSAWEKRDPLVKWWSSQASRWHAALLAKARVIFLLVVYCCCGLLELWTFYTEVSIQSDAWHGEQNSGQVGMMSDSGWRAGGPHSVWYPVTTVLRSWTPEERWEDMDGFLASVERALQVLDEQLPEEASGTAGHVSWMFLAMLRHSMEDALNEIVLIQDQQSQWKALEVCIRL